MTSNIFLEGKVLKNWVAVSIKNSQMLDLLK